MCTRVFYAEKGSAITGRNMDWMEDMHSDLWIFPRNLERSGSVNINPINWKSKYGSIIASSYGCASADGLNEKGLVANVLFLAESCYDRNEKDKKNLTILLWVQYVLDNFANVNEVVDYFKDDPLNISAPILPNGSQAQLHLSVSDSFGDSAIFEYIDGKIHIHHGSQYKVMTNSPIYSEQLAINRYWEGVTGEKFIPGSISAADRFARASYFINSISKDTNKNYIGAIPENSFNNQALLSVLGVIRAISVPLGIQVEGHPDHSSTIWRSVSDSKNLTYVFDSALAPICAWVDLNKIDFEKETRTLRLDLSQIKLLSGNCLDRFKESDPFEVPIDTL